MRAYGIASRMCLSPHIAGYRALEAQTEAAVGNGAKATQVEIPIVVSSSLSPSALIRSRNASKSSSRCEPPTISPYPSGANMSRALATRGSSALRFM